MTIARHSLLCGAVLLGAAFGCSAPAGDGLIGMEGNPPAAAGPAASADPSATATTADGGATTNAPDTGTRTPPPPTAGDAGVAPPPPSVFNGAGAFAASTAPGSHNAGQSCMGGCHDHGFTFAGTLTDGAGNGVAGAEVRLVDATGAAITVHTGPEGNFHSSVPFTGAAHAGARTATTAVNMVSTFTNGGCNACHATGGTTTRIHVP